MRQSLIIFCVSMVFFSHIFAQQFWERTEPYSGTLNKMYFGGGDTIYGTLSSGFIRSTDNGTTWSTPVIVDYVTDMAVAPNGNIFLSQNQKKISRSTNKGTSWTIVGTGINEPSCNGVITTATGAVLVSTNAGIYRSTNNGDSWQKVAGAAQLGNDTTISCLATNDGLTLYAFAGRNLGWSSSCYTIRSTDDGVTWMKSTGTLDSAFIYKATVHPNGTIYTRTGNGLRYSSDGGNTWGTAGFYNKYVFDFAYSSGGVLYVALGNTNAAELFYKSTNNGASWSAIPTPSFVSGIIAVNKAGNIFVGQDQMYRSVDEGATWKGLPIAYPTVGNMKESPRQELYFAIGTTTYQRLYRSTDFGQSWKALNTGVAGIPVVAFYAETLLVADNYYPARIFRSIDGGNTFTTISIVSVLSGYINALLGTSYNSIIAGTTTGTFRSTDHGKNWTKVSTNSLSFFHQTPDGTIFGLGSGVFRSNDSGTTWQQVTGAMTAVRSLAFAPNGDLIAGADNGVFRSTNKGDAWVRLDTQKVNKPYGTYVAVNKEGKLFVGGAASGVNSKLYQSTDNGATWTYIGDMAAIDNQASIRGIFAASDGHLFAATSNGLFRSVGKTTGIVRTDRTIPSEFLLKQNYPNPFNPSTTISYQLPVNSHVTLTVYDAIGREIASLVNERQSAGNYEVPFDGSNLSSGVYFYKLQAGGFVQTMKMILTK